MRLYFQKLLGFGVDGLQLASERGTSIGLVLVLGLCLFKSWALGRGHS